MKKWKCTVCGYIHEGDAPPAECPLCKAKADKFEEVVEEGAAVRRWRCTICDYIHEGDAPPDECPICKAGPDKFVEIDAEGNEIAAADKPKVAPVAARPVKKQKPSLLVRAVLKLHLHPISVHMPQGVLPAAVIFLAIAMFLGLQVFEVAAFYNMVFVLLTMPAVLVTGYLEWQNRYKGAKTIIFLMKIFASATVTLSLIGLVLWRFLMPDVASPDSPYRLIYFGVAAIMVGATAIAGNLGGKLVFGSRK